MQRYFSRVTVILFSIFLQISASLKADISTSYFVFLQDGIGELQKSEKQVAFDVWNEWTAQDGNYQLSTTWVTTMQDLLKIIKNKKVDYALLDGSNFIKYFPQLKPNLKGETWVVQRTEKQFEEYVLLTSKESKATELKQLKGTTLSLHSELRLLKMYLDYIVKKSTHTSAENHFKIIREAKTESQSILDVFFGYSEACLVAKHVLEDAIELNPAIRNKIKIIHHSGEIFIPVIYIAFNNASDITLTRFAEAVDKLHNTVRGQQMLDLFGVHAIKKIEQKELYPMLKINAQLHQQEF